MSITHKLKEIQEKDINGGRQLCIKSVNGNLCIYPFLLKLALPVTFSSFYQRTGDEVDCPIDSVLVILNQVYCIIP